MGGDFADGGVGLALGESAADITDGDDAVELAVFVDDWEAVVFGFFEQVKDFRDAEWMLWWDKTGDTSWAWGIYSEGETCSRLVTRVRVKYRWFSPAILFNLIIEFFDILMMRKCMLGIKRRAEALPLSKPLTG